MTKYLFFLLALTVTTSSFAQKKPSDPALSKRLNDYMRLTRKLKFDQIMDYTHPSIFAIVPREQLVDATKQAFDNERFNIFFDSTGIGNISSDFQVKNAHYKKIDYWMVVEVHFKDTSLFSKDDFITSTTAGFEKSFSGGRVHFNPDTHNFEIRAASIMIAIKDDAAKPWMFLGYQKNSELLNRLYPKEVIDHYKLL